MGSSNVLLSSSRVSSSRLLVAAATLLLASAVSSTALAQSCPPEAPNYCSDGYCYDVPCESVTTCPDSAPYECSDGYCYETSDCGGSTTSCPDEAPYYCSDGYCYDIPCEDVASCPDSAPYYCSDGSCYDVPCESVSTCPAEAPNLCSDGYCYASSDCSACPPGYPYDCGNEYCGSTEQACVDNTDTTPSVPPSTPGPALDDEAGQEYCSDAGLAYDGCESIQACCTTTSCRYLTDDGSSFDCNGTDCYAAADEMLAYCEDQAGCSASPGPARGGLTSMMAVAALALSAAVRTARSRGAARVVRR